MVKIFNCEECGAETSSTSPLARYCSKRCKHRVKDRRRTPERNPQYWQRRKQRQKERYQENYERLRPYYQKWRREHRVPKNCRTCGIALPFGQRKYCSRACLQIQKQNRQIIKKQNTIKFCKSCAIQVQGQKQYCESCRVERERYWAIRWRLDPDYRASQVQLRRQRRANIQAAKVFLRELDLMEPIARPRSPESKTFQFRVKRKVNAALKRECIIEAKRLWESWGPLLTEPRLGSGGRCPIEKHWRYKSIMRPAFGNAVPLCRYIAEILALRGMYVKPRRILLWHSKNWRLPKIPTYESKRKRRYNPIARRREYERELQKYGKEEIRSRKREREAMDRAILRTVETTLKQEMTQ